MTDYQEQLAECQANNKNLFASVGEAGKGFGALHAASVADGVLDTKTKELIALAIAVTRECDGCIASHAHGAASAGATEQEVAEMIGVAILMNGGTGTVYGPRALAAFRDYASA